MATPTGSHGGDDSFANICTAIKEGKVKVVNCTKFAKSGGLYGNGVGASLLQLSTHVEDVESINLSDLFPCYVQTGSYGFGNDAAPFLQFLRESTSLRRVQFVGRIEVDDNTPFIEALAFEFCKAMACNPFIEEIELRSLIPGSALCHLLKHQRALKCLTVIELKSIAEDHVREAIQGNSTLETFQLGLLVPKLASTRILKHVGTLVKLKTLILDGTHGPISFGFFVGIGVAFTPVRDILRTSRSLKHLHLKGFSFKENDMKRFVAGLTENKSLTKLTIGDCEFDKAATKMLIQYMNTPTVDGKESLHELDCKVYGKKMWQGTWDDVVVRMLTVPKRTKGPTIGSQLSVLRIHGGNKVASFKKVFEVLGKQSPPIRLECLQIGRINRAGVESLVQCLPNLIHLKELTAMIAQSDVDIPELLDALRRNGSLEKVKLDNEKYMCTIALFDANQKRLVEAYCARNRGVPQLLTERQMSPNGGEPNTSIVTELLSESNHAAIFAPSRALTDMMSLAENIGPRFDGKRSATLTE